MQPLPTPRWTARPWRRTCIWVSNQAQKRLYIYTPYLILDNDLLSCLRGAAKRGVDVRIYTPGVPDEPTSTS